MARHWVLLAVVVLTSVAGGAAYLTLQKPTPAPADRGRAALLQVRPQTEPLLPGRTPLTALEVETIRKTHLALVKSEFVLHAALRKLGDVAVLKKQPDAVAWLTDRVTAELPEGGEVLRIGVRDVDAKDAATIANAVAQAYVQEAVQKDVADMRRRLNHLRDALATVQKQLTAHRDDRAKRAAEAGLPPGGTDRQAALAALYQERAGLRIELAREDRKRVREALEVVGEKIKLAEAAGLDGTAAEVAHLESASAALATEILRAELDLTLPPRVRLLQLAETPKAE
jgi:uncharacterized protein involved in exopolysaccharide biosynthesis